MGNKGEIVEKSPTILTLEKDKNYAWCACGKSDAQPWCNGAHQGSEFIPEVFKVEDVKPVAMCMCKQTNNPPYCDGSHNKI